MHRFVYKLTNGRASDIRFIPDGEKAAADEIEGNADVLPDVEALSTSPPPVQSAAPTLADVIAVLPQNLKDAIQAEVAARKAVLPIRTPGTT